MNENIKAQLHKIISEYGTKPESVKTVHQCGDTILVSIAECRPPTPMGVPEEIKLDTLVPAKIIHIDAFDSYWVLTDEYPDRLFIVHGHLTYKCTVWRLT